MKEALIVVCCNDLGVMLGVLRKGGGEGWVYVGEKEAGRHERGLVVS